MTGYGPTTGSRPWTLVASLLGGLAILTAMAGGADGQLLDRLVHPPNMVRAALVGGSAMLAVVLLSRGLTRLAGGADDVAGMIRGVRLAFLALAAAAAGAGWFLGDPLPLVIALVIAGIDVLETSLLLFVVQRKNP